MTDFVHLHCHTEYSLLDGACRIKELISRAKELDMSAVAITDHGNMFGAVEFFKEAKSQGIKPIIGCEVYIAARTLYDKTYGIDNKRSHLVLLCKNETGYQNLIKMVSTAWIDGFYVRPRVDRYLLEEYHEGLIALSACLAGEIPKALTADDYELAKETALYYKNLFGEDNFFLELQDHGIMEQKRINPFIVKLSKELGIGLAATNDCHYLRPEDSKMHSILLCIQTGTTLNDPSHFAFEGQEFYFKSKEEMAALFPEYPEAYENTLKIAERCNFEFEFGNTKLPRFDVPDNENHTEYFNRKCREGLTLRYGENPDEGIVKRLEYELKIIEKMGYVDYFLIVQDFVNYARSKDIPVGPGRGSGAGSLAAYCIGITGIDPIKFNLLFERFLNPERVSMPDFDIDFCYERRQEVIDYVNKKYGSDHVAQIATFGTMAAKGSIRDVGRVMGINYNMVDKVAKMIPFEIGMTIDKALGRSTELMELYTTEPDIKELIDMAKRIEGMPRHTSTHAAGVVITDKPVSYYVPLARNDEAVVTQYTMTRLEELGLLKMDFLGLRTLTVISNAEKMIQKENPDFSIEKIPLDDKKVFEMYSQGKTDGVFQFESAGMRRVLSMLSPSGIEDIIAVISLYRPGPMDSIPRYIANRHEPDKIKYKCEALRPILDVTYGCMVYQEQVMEVFRSLAGYSFGRADIVRRAMSKKKHDVMEFERNIFINGQVDEDGNIITEGAVRRGISAEIANSIFDEMSSFASYAFNKSHAAAYAFVSYRTAYLKCRYPRQFMAGLLTSVLDNSGKVAGYIEECSRLGIKVLPPHVNESNMGFTVSGENIRFGLLAVINLGRGVIERLIKEREEKGKFKSFADFCNRMHGKELNRRALENLIKCGALDFEGVNRRQMTILCETILTDIDNRKHKEVEGQMGFFNTPGYDEEPEIAVPNIDEFDLSEKLRMEKESVGIYLSGHPLSEYEGTAQTEKIVNVIEGCKERDGSFTDGQRVEFVVLALSVKKKFSKKNEEMAFVYAEDTTGIMELIVFPRVFAACRGILSNGSVLLVSGRISLREDETPKLICDTVNPAVKRQAHGKNSVTSEKKSSSRPGYYIRVSSLKGEDFERALKVIKIFDGETPLYIYCTEDKKLIKAPDSLRVDVNGVMTAELKRILGENNVTNVE